MIRHHRIAAGLVALALALPGCGRSRPAGGSEDPRVGDMADVSYSGGRDRPYGPNARGRTVGLADFAGRFVWVEYAAPWCAACAPQAEAARAREGSGRPSW